MNIAVIDVAKVFASSLPAEKARTHLAEVQKVLKKGLDDVVALYADRVAAPEAQQAIAQARNLLQQQLNVEQQAADAVIRNLLTEVTNDWVKDHDELDLVLTRQQVVFAKKEHDITDQLIEKMNTKEPVFPDLPKVNINRNK